MQLRGLPRHTRASYRMRLERPARALAASRQRRDVATRRSRVLCFHAVGTPLWGVNDVAPALFRAQLLAARTAGWTFVSAEAIADQPDPPGRLAVTFDDGLRSVATGALPILRELDIPSTLFVVTDWASGAHPTGFEHLLNWEELGELQSGRVVIASHSMTHPDFGRMAGDRVEDEIGGARDELRVRLGVTAPDFAIPLGQAANWTGAAQRAALAAGHRRVWAQAESTRPQGTLPRTFISRFDRPWIFRAALRGAFEDWQEWV